MCSVAYSLRPFFAGLTVIMTVLTKLVAPGPVFFRQERIGCGGRRFWSYKFRTMRVGSDTKGHQDYFKDLIGTNAPMMKLDSPGDSRLIPGSRLLRAVGLDELPQIINVLHREMSIVGPRPCIAGEYAAYQPWQRQRCDAMPGLTELWQVSGKNRTTFEEMVNYDIRYNKTKSWWLDVKIISLTVPALLVQIYDTRVRKFSGRTTARAFATVSLRNTPPASRFDNCRKAKPPLLSGHQLTSLAKPDFTDPVFLCSFRDAVDARERFRGAHSVTLKGKDALFLKRTVVGDFNY